MSDLRTGHDGLPYNADDPYHRAELAWEMPEDLRKSVLHYVAWMHPEVFADAVADAMRLQTEKATFHAGYEY